MADIKESRILLQEKQIREKLLEGAKATYDAVVQSYGPRGKNVLLEKGFGRPVLTRDGVTIARDVFFSDRPKNMGAQLLTEASETTNRIAGDGTTATTAFAYHLLDNGVMAIAAGQHPMQVKDTLIEDSRKLLERLEELAIPVKDGQLKDVAAVSAGDPLIGQLIAEAVLYVGQDGGILTEKAPISEIEREYVDGYYVQSGFTALQAGKKELVESLVVVSNKRITSSAEVNEIVTKVFKVTGITPEAIRGGEIPRITFIGNFEDAAYRFIVDLINKGAIDAVIIKTPPQFGDMGKHLLDDMAIYAGCKTITESTSLKTLDASFVGLIDKVITNKSESTLFADNETELVMARIKQLRDQIENEPIDALSEKLRDRVAKLEGKVCIFKIGGATETEKEELEFRIEDSINSTRNAYAEGIVAGGGVTLLELSKLDVSDITRNALRSTFKQLLINANLPAELKLDEALKAPVGQGYNLRVGDKLVDVVKAGVIDPVVAVREVVKNAMSAIEGAITVGASLTFVDKES